MSDKPAPNTVANSAPPRPRRFFGARSASERASPLSYYLLFALNLIGLLMLARINGLLQDGYVELAESNVTWTQVNQRTAALTKAAREANEPVNEVFHTGQVSFERERLRIHLIDLFALLQAEKAALALLPHIAQRNRLLFNLEQAEKHIKWMAAESRQVFNHLENGQKKQADSGMALSDRKYADFLDVMAQRDTIVQSIQADLFLQGEKYRAGLSRLVYLGIGVIVLLTGLVAFYGVRLSLEARRAMAEARTAGAALRDSEENLLSVNDSLARLLSAQQRFIADAAHQLRTPIAGIKLQIERALKSHTMDEVRPALDQLHAASERVVRLSGQLLTLASAEAGSAHEEDVDLKALARDVGLRWIARAQERGIDLGFEAGAQAVPVRGNTVLLGEMLSNLIDNAMRYSPDHGTITIAISSDPAPQLSVEDSGPGIRPEEREKVFERFHRGPGSKGDGAGLGLAIVHDIARSHGATVALEQARAGQGLCVRITFPQNQDTAVV